RADAPASQFGTGSPRGPRVRAAAHLATAELDHDFALVERPRADRTHGSSRSSPRPRTAPGAPVPPDPPDAAPTPPGPSSSVSLPRAHAAEAGPDAGDVPAERATATIGGPCRAVAVRALPAPTALGAALCFEREPCRPRRLQRHISARRPGCNQSFATRSR